MPCSEENKTCNWKSIGYEILSAEKVEAIDVWASDHKIPIVVKSRKKQTCVRLPYADTKPYNREWLTDARKKPPKYFKKSECWLLPLSRFNDIVTKVLLRFKKIYVVHPVSSEKCAESCWNAKGDDCNCQCMGMNHGMGKPHDKWVELSETFAYDSSSKKYSKILIELK